MVKHPPINSFEYFYEFQKRVCVVKDQESGLWDVWVGFENSPRSFSSYTEAINFAQKRARKVL